MNIALRLKTTAEEHPDAKAVIATAGRDPMGRVAYSHVTFRQLDRESDLVARVLCDMGVTPGTRLVLMVRFGIEFVSLVFAAFKAGAVIVLIDPGMGASSMLDCLEEVEPEGFLAIPIAHAVRIANRRRFRRARFNLTVGPRWFWGGPTYQGLTRAAWQPFETVAVKPTDPAAVIFTSGSTGPAKGVIYEHGMFNAQVDLIRDQFGICPGGVDLSGFPLFGLFNAAMGTTTVVPQMNPSKPAKAHPARIIQAIEDQTVTQSFGSPALWERVVTYCEEHQLRLRSLRRAFSAGAPVPVSLLERLSDLLEDEQPAPEATPLSTIPVPLARSSVNGCHGGEVYTPYGATEALPVASISSHEVLEETAERTRTGAGTCVGRPFEGVAIKIIEINPGPIATLSMARELPAGQIGEIIVQGPSVTRSYLRRPLAEAEAKIADPHEEHGPSTPVPFWHRMGDVGYLDHQGRLWYCGRKSHIVSTAKGPLFTEPCEAIFNEHPRVARSALVGVSRKSESGSAGEQTPVIIVEPRKKRFPLRNADRQKFAAELRDLAAANPLTLDIHTVLFHRSLPVDVRHNSKINRERLALWAANALHGQP
ncbi:MAG TPA: AMP-binding protein [Planctomycetaceae bacterium]|jgi:acyl-CoA synthetase (AMP-forming)/AMP-acid ligase II|nr:AMP-binding protein [Planctomycetaceae bacterium]